MCNRDHRAILLISCPDQRGIVAHVASFIFTHGGNIIHSDQHTDLDSNTFYMRVEWELAEQSHSWPAIQEAFAPLATRFRMDWQLRLRQEVKRVAIFVSKEEHCLWDLLLRRQAGELPMDVGLIIGNHPDLERVALSFGEAFHNVAKSAANRAAAEAQEQQLLAEHRIDLIILARYMQVLSPAFVGAYQNRIINIHHSFLPAFKGARPYHQAYERGVKVIGATSHYVTQELDQGPIIEQDVVRVTHRDTVDDLVRKGRDLEKVVLARAVRLHLNDRILVYSGKTVLFD